MGLYWDRKEQLGMENSSSPLEMLQNETGKSRSSHVFLFKKREAHCQGSYVRRGES